MKKFLYGLTVLLLTAFSSSWAASDPSGDFDKWASDQIASSPVLRQACEEGAERRQTEGLQLNQLKDAIQAKLAEGDIGALVASVRESISKLSLEWDAVKSALDLVPAGEKGWPLRSTKVGLNFQLALEAMSDPSFVSSLLAMDLAADIPKTILAGHHTRWDSSLGRAVKTFLTIAWMRGADKSIDGLVDVFGDHWLENSAFYVGIPLPEGFPGEHPFIINYKGRKTLIEVHNGFVFGGGHGDNVLGEILGRFPVLDCSSFTALHCGMMSAPGAKTPSTLHWLLHAAKLDPALRPFSQHAEAWGKILTDWDAESDEAYRRPLEERIELVPSGAEVSPGMIYVRRTFNLDKVTSSPATGLYGTGGHMGLVVGVRDGNVWILSANRSMKEKPGVDWDFSYALQAQLLESTEDGKIFYFTLKE